MNAIDLLKIYEQEKSSSERGNFNRLYESPAEWCNPSADNIQSSRSPGQRKSAGRLIDIGIKARRMFTAGMMSHMFPRGQHWIRIATSDRELMENDNVKRALSAANKRFMSDINNSNFYEEMGSCIDHCGYIGTTALYCESTKKEKLVWRSHYINQFYFCENYEGKVDTFIREFKLTDRLAIQQFVDESP